MRIGIPKETRDGETRVAISPDVAKKLIKLGCEVAVETGAGMKAGFPDDVLKKEGCLIVSRDEAFQSDIVWKIQKPNSEEIEKIKSGSLLFSHLEPYLPDNTLEKLNSKKINACALELIPRTSRAQSMDVLSSQANIAGYRCVLEAATHYPRFFSMMMTSAGSAKQAQVAVLGVGVAGLQAIATARRLGASVEAYDVRPEVAEQIKSVGAKVIELDVGESGSGQGGYAKELSDAAKAKQQQQLTEKLKKFDVIVTTANIPGKKSPTLVTEEAVKGMRAGSVIIDLAAANGGNCPLTEANKIVVKHGVTLVGLTQYPCMVPADSSSFYSRNLFNLFQIFLKAGEKTPTLNYNLEDDIIAGCLVSLNGEIRNKRSN